MSQSLGEHVEGLLGVADASQEGYAAAIVDGLLQAAATLRVSDLHLQPTREGLELKWRIDGVLHAAGMVPQARAANVLARLKVLAGLLTYRSETPQEGRIRDPGQGLEFRVSTFPTLYGERGVVRLLAMQKESFQRLEQLGFDPATEERLRGAGRATSGAVLLVGPAGSGKTTTAYTLLREILRGSVDGRSVASLEDPIEAAVDGVAQSQINPAAGFDLLTALRSLVRQDPEVIFVGEIRDAEVAKVAYQAAMTGQLVVTTFHASDAADALARLLDMGIPPYVVRGATRLIVAQRLLRRACKACGGSGRAGAEGREGSGAEVNREASPGDRASKEDRLEAYPMCGVCRGTGYRGRVAVAEGAELENVEVAQAVLDRADAGRLRGLLAKAGYASLLEGARTRVNWGETTRAELVRMFGLDEAGNAD